MELRKCLAAISTVYSYFEDDQMLTPGQLNSIADYFEGQTRLTRVSLLGVGVLCGLRVAWQGNMVKVTKGVGVTTDGDLLYFGQNQEFDRYRRYGETRPKYAPFYQDQDLTKMIPVYELAPRGQKDEQDNSAENLSDFESKTNKKLKDMAAVLLMESYRTDRDLCTVTHCDDLGQDNRNNVKLLLVEKAHLGRLPQTLPAPPQDFLDLREIAAERALIPPQVASFPGLREIYGKTCTVLINSLAQELAKMPKSAPFLEEMFPGLSFEKWKNLLKEKVPPADFGMQYYYDFLKDVVETFNHLVRVLHDLVTDDLTRCCPEVAAFPKHLLLGNLIPGANPEENRTPFYPAPLSGRTSSQLAYAAFLARKIEVMIKAFQAPKPSEIRITPSLFEDRPLEDRAIPCYYQVKEGLLKNWNYRLTRRGLERTIYSYHAAAYKPEGGAADPLKFQIGRFPFFRIEGHLGLKVEEGLEKINEIITENRLPLTVRAVLLDPDRKWLKPSPGIRYSDLHRFHYLLRQDVLHQLDDAVNFGKNFRAQVEKQVMEDIADDPGGLRDKAEKRTARIEEQARKARQSFSRNRYSDYKKEQDPWRPAVKETMKAAGEIKYELGNVIKTEFPTPFDTMIGNTQILWLDWLDAIIDRKDEQESEKLLFRNFLVQHPGLEHYAGVVRGGTFVLGYDPAGIIVADFMLPYYCEEAMEAEAEEPELKKPEVKPDWWDCCGWTGIKVLQERGKMLNLFQEKFKKDQLDPKLEGLRKELEPKIDGVRTELKPRIASLELDLQPKIADQEKYFKLYRDSIDLITKVLPVREDKEPSVVPDRTIDKIKTVMREKQVLIRYVDAKAAPGQPDAERYRPEAEKLKGEMAEYITKATNYLAESDIDVSAGSEGAAVLLEVNKGLDLIKDSANASRAAKEGLRTVRPKNELLRSAVEKMIAR